MSYLGADMFGPVDTKVPSSVEAEVRGICGRMYGAGDAGFVGRVFGWVEGCFAGRHPEYQPIDALYHDLEHTLQGTLCLARLLEGRHRAGIKPALSRRGFELGLVAILFHDTGYLKRRGDTEGTGAKYTVVHVERSAQFAREFLQDQEGFGAGELKAIQNMIRCTGVNADLEKIPFQSAEERWVGCALATADLLGQMAAPDYVEKLRVLFLEFAEAARYDGGLRSRFAAYREPEDLMRRTRSFWLGYVRPRIEVEFGGLYAYLSDPYPDGPNEYLRRIERNLERMDRALSGAAAGRQG